MVQRLAALLLAILLLTLATLAALLVLGWIAYSNYGRAGVAAAALAATICWVGGSTALMITASVGVGTPDAVKGVLAAIFFRMGLPLFMVMALHRRGGWLVEAGVLEMILVFYLVTLAVETTLAVRLVKNVVE